MLKYLACLIGLFAIIAVAPARGEAPANQAPAQKQDRAQGESPAQKQTPAGTQPLPEQAPLGKAEALQPAGPPAQPPPPAPPPPARTPSRGVSAPLNPLVAITLFSVVLLAFIGALIAWVRGKPDPSKLDDKDLEALRITYGFWLVIGALLVTLFVLVVTLSALAPEIPTTTDIVAIIGAIAGVIGTLTAAFFGIQAAGAGRSQAMTALSEQLKAQGGTAAYKLEPSYGPHAGGTLVSISGNGFTGANAVNFGVTLGTDFKNINDGLVRANSPQAPQGVDDTNVVVVFPGASPTNREVGTFYYYTIDPSRGRASSENTVTIRGSGLKGANWRSLSSG